MVMIKRKKIIIYNVRPTLSREGHERSDYPSLDLAAESRRFRGARIAGGVSPSQNPMHFCWVGTATRGRAVPSCRFKVGEGAALGILICKFRLRYREG